MNRIDFDSPGGLAMLPVADRQPPYAPEAEISVLGGMLIDGDAVARALEVVDATGRSLLDWQREGQKNAPLEGVDVERIVSSAQDGSVPMNSSTSAGA